MALEKEVYSSNTNKTVGIIDPRASTPQNNKLELNKLRNDQISNESQTRAKLVHKIVHLTLEKVSIDKQGVQLFNKISYFLVKLCQR